MKALRGIVLLIILLSPLVFSDCQRASNPNFIYEAYRDNRCGSIFPLDPEQFRKNGEEPRFWYFVGLCHMKMGDFVQARESFLTSKKLDYKYDIYVEFGLSVAELNLGNPDKGFEHLQASLDNGLSYRFLDHQFFNDFKDTPRFIRFKERNRPSFNFWTSLLLILSLQGIMFGIYLIFHKRNKVKNTYLGLFIISFCLLTISYSLALSKWTYHFPFLRNIYHMILYCIGPLLFLYCRSVFRPSEKSTRYILHFLPVPVIAYALLQYESNALDYSIFTVVISPYLKVFHMLVYGLLAYRVYARSILRINRNVKFWFGLVIGLYGFFVASNLFSAVYFDVYSHGPLTDVFIIVALCLFIFMVTLMGYVQPQVFWGESVGKALKNVKYGKSGLSKGLSLELKNQLMEKIEGERLYLKSDLSLEDLADVMSVSRRHVSQVINENFEMGFYDFINSYRIEEAKKMLLEGKDEGLKVQEIAYKVGFNNKASFYSSFKKFTNATPKEFLGGFPS